MKHHPTKTKDNKEEPSCQVYKEPSAVPWLSKG